MIEILHLVSDAAINCVGASPDACSTGLPTAGGGQIKTILQIVFAVFAALAVLMIAIGGLRFVASGGNPEDAKQGRGTILYALIGLVVAISAEAIVSFVLGQS